MLSAPKTFKAANIKVAKDIKYMEKVLSTPLKKYKAKEDDLCDADGKSNLNQEK